jgi:hypothetical protein
MHSLSYALESYGVNLWSSYGGHFNIIMSYEDVPLVGVYWSV